MTEEQVNDKIAKLNKKLSKEKNPKKIEEYKAEIAKLENLKRLMKKDVETTSDEINTSTEVTKAPTKPVVNKKPVVKNKPVTSNADTEKRLENVEEKAINAADAMNSEEEKKKKTEDAKSAAETARDRAAQIDANVEENVPTWFWREAKEMAPSDKAKRGFIITNHILNRLGTALGNTGAIFQNAGGSGGASLKEHGGSYIDQYRQSKIEQAMANRKTKQNSLLQQQIDALVAIGVPENEARVIQNKLRNSKHWNKYNRLTNEQQVYIQGLLYNDTKGKINDAALGNFIDQLMEGKNVSLEQAAVNMMAAEGIDNIDEIKSGAKAIGDKVIKWLNWDKPGQ